MKQVLTSDLMDAIAIKIGEYTLSGVGLQKQAEMLSKDFNVVLSYKHVERYRKRDACQNFMAEATQAIKRHAVADLIRRVSKLVPLIESTIISNLEDGNINAVPQALKIIGLGEEEKQTGSQSLTVVMPGAVSPEKKVIEVDSADAEEG